MKMTGNSRWQFLLLALIIISLLAYPAAGCTTPTAPYPQPVPTVPPGPTPTGPSTHPLVPLINDIWGYTVYYPQDWYRESNQYSDGRSILDFHAPEPRHGMLIVEVYDIEKMEIEADINLVAQQWIDNAKDLWGEISLQENTKPDNSWDWYYDFNGVLWKVDFHVRTYLKLTDNFLYVLKLQLVEDDYDNDYLSNLEQIPEVFIFHAA